MLETFPMPGLDALVFYLYPFLTTHQDEEKNPQEKDKPELASGRRRLCL